MDNAVQQAQKFTYGRMFGKDNSGTKEKRILVLKTGIAGMYYYVKNEEEKQAIENLKPGDELLLYREPENEHDKWAVAVYLTENDKIGFITRFKNETIARLMDVGKKFIGVVDDPDDEETKKVLEEERKRDIQAPTEDMRIPFSVFMIEKE